VTTAPLAFGPFQLHIERRMLSRDGEPLALGARALDLLCALALHRDRIVDKDELMTLAWPGMVVEENNLAVQVGSLRKLLGPHVIATVRGRGYRFVAAVDDGATRKTAPVRPTNLPATLPPLIGRAEECAALAGWIATTRLVTVVGAGGIGKSRLAQAVAHAAIGRWPDGVWMIELAGLSDPALVANAVAQPLGIAPRERAQADATLVAELATREMLLVLDNCEHLLDAVAALAQGLLAAAPGVRLLATSQEPLRLAQEQQMRLEPLSVPADAATPHARDYGAIALFAARVNAVDPGFALTDDRLAQAVALCLSLDGLPLAIELAAARVPLLGLRTVHDRIDERFRLLTAGQRTALPRHQTLRAAMAWSHSLLTDSQRLVFRRLGVFHGGFTMTLAQAVCDDERLRAWKVLEHVGALVDKSLLIVEPAEPPRYRLLESARAFALEELANAHEADALQAAHARAMTDFLRTIDDANLDGELRTDAYAARVLPELDNLRAAYAWARADGGDRAIAIALAASATPLADYSVEFRDWLLEQRPFVLEGAVDAAIEARFARGLAAFNMHGSLTRQESLAAARRAASLYRAMQQPRRFVSSLRLVAAWSIEAGDHAGAAAALDEADALIQPEWGAEFRMTLLRSRTRLASDAGRMEAALATAREAVDLARRCGDWRLEVIERTNHAEMVWQAGDPARAAALLDALAAQTEARPVTHYELMDIRQMRSAVASESDDLATALHWARAALVSMRACGHGSLPPLAHLLWKLDRCEDAARVIGAFDARARSGLEIWTVNDDRLLAAAREGVAARLEPTAMAAQAALGASLDRPRLCAWLAQELVFARISPLGGE
jgi:predicted ATPase/DNA-binding winged helix-turn-helix (wHTH) protein